MDGIKSRYALPSMPYTVFHCCRESFRSPVNRDTTKKACVRLQSAVTRHSICPYQRHDMIVLFVLMHASVWSLIVFLNLELQGRTFLVLLDQSVWRELESIQRSVHNSDAGIDCCGYVDYSRTLHTQSCTHTFGQGTEAKEIPVHTCKKPSSEFLHAFVSPIQFCTYW